MRLCRRGATTQYLNPDLVTAVPRVQEYCNGGTVKDSIAAGYFSTGSMPHRWSPLIAVLGSIADGMEYMHSQRICHGDLNPSNVLLKVRRPRKIVNAHAKLSVVQTHRTCVTCSIAHDLTQATTFEIRLNDALLS